jgi:D-alanyl-D-alanine carboxypeptidase
VKVAASKHAPALKSAPAHTAAVAAPAAPAPTDVKAAQGDAKVAPVDTKAAAAPSPAPAARPGILGVLPAAVAAAGEAIVPSAKAATLAEPPHRKVVRRGWAIQIGAFEDEGEAKERLNAAQSKAAKILDKADPYTERTVKGDKTYYRARFAGFDRDHAIAACRMLKRSDIVCMPLKI